MSTRSIAEAPSPTRDEAIASFKALIGRYGLRWDSRVPAAAHEELARANTVLSADDRRSIAMGRR
jgi:hypothetical protein